MTTKIYVSGTGQNDNIGDALLRRALLRALRDARFGELHILIDGLPDDYVSGLGLQDGDVSYDSGLRWRASLLRDASIGRAAYGFNAGEVNNISARRFSRRPARIARLANARGRGSFWTGVGIRKPSDSPDPDMAFALESFSLISWRDEASHRFAGVGRVNPDWAFAEGSPAEVLRQGAPRDVLAVTARGDRPEPSDRWYATVEDVARRHSLAVQVVSQVRRDGPMSERIAARLGAELVPWRQQDFAEQEAALRAIYRRSAAVVSDRLHAVIMGATEGAVPIGLGSDAVSKIDRTLAVAGLDGFVFDLENDPVDGIQDGVAHQVAARQRVVDAVEESRTRLKGLIADIGAMLRS